MRLVSLLGFGRLRPVPALVLALMASTTVVFGQQGFEAPRKKVLALHLVRGDSPAYESAFREILHQGLDGRLEYFSEFIAVNRVSEAKYRSAFGSYLRTRYGDEGLDLVIASSETVVEFLNQDSELFAGVPLVYAAKRALSGGPDSTGLLTPIDFVSTLEAAMTAQPGLADVFVISGAAPFDRTYAEIFRTQRAPFEQRLAFHDLAGLPLAELERQVARLPAASIVFYLTMSEDGAGRTFLPFDPVSRIAAAANAAVYSWHTNALGLGIVGGLLRSPTSEAQDTARLALRVLNGESADRIPVVSLRPGTLQFDARQLRRWQISESQLPPGSIVSFRTQPFLTQYRGYILSGVCIIAGQLVLIGGLLVQRRRRRRAEAGQRQAEERNRALLQAVPDLMFVLDRDGRFLDFSARDAGLLFAPPEQFLGRTVREIMPPDLADRLTSAIVHTLDGHAPVTVTYELPMEGVQHFEARLVPAGKETVMSIVRDVTTERRATDLNRVLAGRLILNQEAERQRIGRQLHDDFSQRIALLNINVDRLVREQPQSSLRLRLEEVSSLAESIASDLYSLSHELHPSRLQVIGIVESARCLCRQVSQTTDLLITFTHAGMPTDLESRVSLYLYRTLQEALDNVVKHSQSSEARVRIEGEGEWVLLEVADSGVGIAAARLEGAGLGLVSMRERAVALGGRLTLETPARGGTRLRLALPLTPAVAAEDSAFQTA
jgi:PAS domain S-box-containing protein